MYDYNFDITESEYVQAENGQLIPADGEEHYISMGEWGQVQDGILVLNYRGYN